MKEVIYLNENLEYQLTKNIDILYKIKKESDKENYYKNFYKKYIIYIFKNHEDFKERFIWFNANQNIELKWDWYAHKSEITGNYWVFFKRKNNKYLVKNN